MSKCFSIDVIIAVITLLCTSEDDFVNWDEILDYMVGQKLSSYYQKMRASSICSHALMEQYPDLKQLLPVGIKKEDWHRWISEQKQKFPKELIIKPLSNYLYMTIEEEEAWCKGIF